MNKKIIAGVAVLVIAGGAFYGGMVYAKKTTAKAATSQSGARQFAQGGGFAGRGARGGANGGGLVAGQILSKDDKSITVKMMDGSSKIIFLSGSTSIGKTSTGTPEDLSSGEMVIVNGSSNSDGSVAAQNIQIRPQGFQPPQNQPNQPAQ